MSDVHPLQVFVPIDLCERCGVEAARLLEGMTFDRVTLSEGRGVSWDEYVAVIERAVELVGHDRLAVAVLSTHETTGDLALASGLILDPIHFYHLFARALLPRLCRPLVIEVVSLGRRRVRLDARLRPGYRGSTLFFDIANRALATIPAHLGLPIATIVSHEFGPRHSSTVLDLPPSRTLLARARERGMTRAWDDARELLQAIADGRSRDRERVRQALIVELGSLPAEGDDLFALGTALGERLERMLGLHGVRIAVGDPPRAICIRGREEGVRLHRSLRYGGADLGEIVAHADPARIAPITYALDAIVPWASAVFGMALDRAEAQGAMVRAEHDEGAAAMIDAAVAVLETKAVFTLGPDASLHSLTEPARRVMHDPEVVREVIRAASGQRVEGWCAVRGETAGIFITTRADPAHFMDTIGASERERAVLADLLAGRSNKEIGVALGISESTVEGHLTALYRKAGVKNRFELLLAASR